MKNLPTFSENKKDKDKILTARRIRSSLCSITLIFMIIFGCGNITLLAQSVSSHTASSSSSSEVSSSDNMDVKTQRVWSSDPGSKINFDMGTIMPNGSGIASTDWKTGEPAVFDLASQEFSRFNSNDEPYDKGIALSPVPSPDGGRIAFSWSDFAERKEFLRLADVTTGKLRTIMTADSITAKCVLPVAWNPAGDEVFAWVGPLDENSGVDVMLVPYAGGIPRLVHTIPPNRADPERMSVSPDGNWLLYNHAVLHDGQWRSDIYIIDVKDGGAFPLVEHSATDLVVDWLPGTNVVLFSSDRSGTTDLWSLSVANGKASGEPQLVHSGFFQSQPVGFGDGALFYRVETGSKGQSVINMNPQTGALLGGALPPLEELGGNFRGIAWSPDGERLASVTRERGNRGSITLHSMQTGGSRVYSLDEDFHPLVLEWEADGKALIIRAGERNQVPTGPHHFMRLDLETGNSTRLFAEADLEESPPLWPFLVTPDGRSIILRQQETLDDNRTEIKLVLRSLEDGSENELYRTSGFIPEFSISADGTQLAFIQQVWEDSDSLFVMRMDGSQQLKPVANWDYDAVSLLGWLPGGNALLTAGLTEDAKAEEILRVDLDGSTTLVGTSPFRPMRGQKTQGYYRSRLTLSPAGNRLVHFVSDVGEELWRMDGLHELITSETGRK